LQKHSSIPGRSETSIELTVPPHPQNVLPEPSDTRGRPRTHEGVREFEYSPFDAKAPLQLRPYPSVEGFGHENISSAGTGQLVGPTVAPDSVNRWGAYRQESR
jgi:hypothetical protein